MAHTITIDPVTRIEGHAKVELEVGDDGGIKSARMIIKELRGFERLLVGMEADRMMLVTARICGVCPSAHHLAATKAVEDALGVDPPPAAKILRELLYMGHFIHSHVLSLFVLQGPDLVLGTSDASKRNIVGMVEAAPELTKKALRLRTLGQKINEVVGGRGVHPVTAVLGGMSYRLDAERKGKLEKLTEEALALAIELVPEAKRLLFQHLRQNPEFLNRLVIPSWYFANVKDGKVNFYDGDLVLMDPDGKIRHEFGPRDYRKYLRETVVDWAYAKPIYLEEQGQRHLYRVNTLARINCAEAMETPLAQQELQVFREAYGRPCHHTMLFAYARIIELIYACEKARALLADPEIDGESRVEVKMREGHGFGHVEAPRGVLLHDYEIDAKGIVRAANLIVATQHNYAAINHTIHQAADALGVTAEDEKLLNGVESAIRCYDPCLSCSTHAVGRMLLDLDFVHDGEVVRSVRRAAK